MHIIGKLSKDWKADWLNWWMLTTLQDQPSPDTANIIWCLGTDCAYPTIRGTRKHQPVDHYITELCEWLPEAFKEAQMQFTSEVERQKWYDDRKAKSISLEPDDWVLAKANAYMGRRKVKDQLEEEPYEVEHQVAEGVPSYLVKNQWTGHPWVCHQYWLFLITLTEGTLLCTVVNAKWARCTNTALEEQTPERSETEESPQSANCSLLAQHQTDETPLGWVNRKLHAFMWTFSRASWLDKGEKFDVEGWGCVEVNVSIATVEVLITLVKLKRYDWPWLPEPHLSSF